MMARFVSIEGLILVKKIGFCEKTRIDIAVFEIKIGNALVVNMSELFANTAS